MLFDRDAIRNRARFQFHGEAAADIASARGSTSHDHIRFEINRHFRQQRDVRLGAIFGEGNILAQAIKKLGEVDLVGFGKQAIDGDTGLVPAGVARRLGWPFLSYVAKIDELDPGSKSITVTRLLEQGRQSVGSRLPAVISVVKEINEPRYPSFMNIRKASKLQIPIMDAAAIGAEAGKVGKANAAAQWLKVFPLPARAGTCEMIAGDSPQAIAASLAEKLLAEKVI